MSINRIMKTITESVKYSVLKRIESLPFNAIFRSDVADLGETSKISYALTRLVKEHRLAHLGYGIYAKMEPVKRLNMFVLKADFLETTREVLDRLHVEWEPGLSEKKYNSGASTQVPVNCPVIIKSYFNRKLTYKNLEFEFERLANTKRNFVTH